MGAYLSEPITQKNIKTGSKGSISYCLAEMQGWRKSMEDAAIHDLDIGDGNSLFAVFDGHGGFQVSECVKQIFIKTLKETPEYTNKNYMKALDETFRKIDEFLNSPVCLKHLQKLNQSRQTHRPQNRIISHNSGCTGNVVLITQKQYIVANIGDSRSALMRANICINMSDDHKPDNPEQERRIRDAGGEIKFGRVNGLINMTRCFGDFEFKQNKNLSYSEQMITCKPDIKIFKKNSSDTFILMGCDGIWEKYVDNSEGLLKIIQNQLQKKSMVDILKDLLDQLIAKDTNQELGCDNMTAILIKLK